MNARSDEPRRALVLLGVLFCAAFLGLMGRLIYIRLTSHEALLGLATGQYTREVPVKPFRGAVVDARGRPLATTVEAYSVFADPVFIRRTHGAEWRVGRAAAGPHDAAVALSSVADGTASHSLHAALYANARARHVWDRLADAIAVDPEFIQRKLRRNADRRFVWLKRRADAATKELVRELGIPGIGVIPESKRCYPTGDLTVHVVGSVGSENQGLCGLEYLLDNRLRGSEGRRVVRVDAKRRPVGAGSEGYEPARDGQVVVLNLDLTVQMFARQALVEAVETFGAKGGSAVVMNPQTGELLALVNHPSFEPGQLAEAEPYARRNRVLTDPYEPGSTFKCFIASAALEAGVVRPGEEIFCHNGLHFIRGRRLRDVSPHGNLAFEEVVIRSSNIGMGIIGDRMGAERLHRALERFGFGRPTGILLPGEGKGLVHPLDQWSAWSPTSVAMGYEVLVTPLQLLTAFSAIANHGVLMKPRLVGRAYGPDGEVLADLSTPVRLRRVLTRETADFMRRRVLRRVVADAHGTGRRAAIPGYRVFGKTGTAKKGNPDGPGYSDRLYVASFVGAAPLENPRVAALVVVDEPDASISYYGGTVAAPAVKQILERTLPYLGVPPDEPSRMARANR